MQRALHDHFFVGKFNIRIESLEGANGNSEILSSAANLLERVCSNKLILVEDVI